MLDPTAKLCSRIPIFWRIGLIFSASVVLYLGLSSTLQPQFLDGTLSVSEGLKHIKLAQDAKDDTDNYDELDAVLSTSNRSLAEMSADQEWSDFFNGIHSLAWSASAKSGSVEEPSRTGDKSNVPLEVAVIRWVMTVGTPKQPVDYRALNYAERLYRKALALGAAAGRGYPSDFRELSRCYRKAGDKTQAEKAMNSYRDALLKEEDPATHWSIRMTALPEHAMLLESEGNFQEAEAKLKLRLTIAESVDDLSPAGLKKMRQTNIDERKKFGRGSSLTLYTCCALDDLARFYERTDRRMEEKEMRKRSQEIHDQIAAP